jgi:hypothetical protein
VARSAAAAAGRGRAGSAIGGHCCYDGGRARADLRVGAAGFPLAPLLDSSTADRTAADWEVATGAATEPRPGRAKEIRRVMSRGWRPERETAAWVMSYCRAHQESVRRRAGELRDPLAPDTDRYLRRIREKKVDCRTDGAGGRDEMDVGVRSCGCGVAGEEKCCLNGSRGPRGTLTRIPEPDSVRKACRYGYARARMVLSLAGNVQQAAEW